MKIKTGDLFDAFLMNNGLDSESFICRRTGAIYSRSDYVDPDEPLPDDLDDEEKYLPLPGQYQLGLGRSLALDFTRDHMPDELDEVYGIFRRKGAFGRFKSLLQRKGALDRWYAYEEKRQEEALRDWCADNGIEIDEG